MADERARILLTEGSSLTSRETLTALRSCGLDVDVLSCASLPLARFSRWRGRLLRVPNANADPLAYLEQLVSLVDEGGYIAVLPTHEQAWLLAEGRRAGLVPDRVPLALASAEAFARVQGKIAFAELLDELDVPQPTWRPIATGDATLPDLPLPFWVKADFGTAGRSTRRVHDAETFRRTVAALSASGTRLMAQAEAPGTYGQVAGLFDQGRLVASHTTVQTGVGAGNSAAARLSVDFPLARKHLALVGERIGWHGPLTLDFMHVDGRPRYLECNPRMIEPGNAERAGVNFPALLMELSRGVSFDGPPLVGAPGVRTRSRQALLLGAAERCGTRRAVFEALVRPAPGIEVLTPVRADPPSIVPLAAVAARLLANPRSVAAIAADAVSAYSVEPAAIERIRSEGAHARSA
ncbi:hypothetical protein [Eggerthella sinensis]|uniref:ATP-grasp domain-containing protein n=1 Tax=Eggerthella sinensis TaxID=242230 RepID=A0A3N0IZJ8_9ACTN|nr:hypothetical protein [Eggerthella sinensis]RDB70380.1 hypothetical protein C1876_03860 [Eggerthella sinensis]RNM42418.1 hypothetical protein DMP09_05175 [Eggerthella sinensis]